MSIELLSFKDFDACYQIFEEAYAGQDDVHSLFKKEFLESFENVSSSLTFIGYRKDEQLVGVAGFSGAPMSERVWELCWATVLSNYQGIGIGAAMLDYRVDMIKERAALKPGAILVHTRPTNLYLSRGFEKTKKIIEEKYILAKDI